MIHSPLILDKLDVRQVFWNHADLIERNCPICNSGNSTEKYVRPDNLQVKFCMNCNLFFISPSPSNTQILNFYNNYDVEYRTELPISKWRLKRELDNTSPFSDLRIKIINSLMELENKKVFDVGFGRAKFLYQLKKLGALTYGCEFDSKAINYAAYLGINQVFDKDISELDFKEEFDLIILNDIIEHPLNPVELLNSSLKMLKTGGIISIWTPNGKYGDNMNNHLTYRVDLEHMQYFTIDTFKLLSNKYNLKILFLQEIGFPSLFGIDSTSTLKDRLFINIKKILSLIPGYYQFKDLLKKSIHKENEETGNYSIFCVLQKIQ